MTPKEALQILDQVTVQVTANREVHGKIVQALQVLTSLVEESDKLLKEDTNKKAK